MEMQKLFYIEINITVKKLMKKKRIWNNIESKLVVTLSTKTFYAPSRHN